MRPIIFVLGYEYEYLARRPPRSSNVLNFGLGGERKGGERGERGEGKRKGKRGRERKG